MTSNLSVSVLNSGYRPIPGGPGWDPTEQATWPARTSTLIAGDRDAMLVDAFLTKSEGEDLAEWVSRSGKSPSTVFITHGHGDHFFGAGPTLAAYPDAQLVTLSPPFFRFAGRRSRLVVHGRYSRRQAHHMDRDQEAD